MSNFLRFILFVSVGLLLDTTICCVEPESFAGTYLNMIVRQYDYYRSIKEPGKILVVGGSSIACGIDLDVMEMKTGRPCAEMGVHLGMGISFLLEASKSNLHSGDVVIIEFYDEPFEEIYKPGLILAGIGKRADMYRYFLPRDWIDVAIEYPKYVTKSYFYNVIPFLNERYAGSSFDERGCMTALRERKNGIDLNHIVQIHGEKQRFSIDSLSKEYLEVLNNYVDYCKSKNVAVFFTHTPYFDEILDLHDGDIARFDDLFSSKLHAPLITSLEDSIYSGEYIWDHIHHLTTEGAKIRSERLAEALKPYLESK